MNRISLAHFRQQWSTIDDKPLNVFSLVLCLLVKTMAQMQPNQHQERHQVRTSNNNQHDSGDVKEDFTKPNNQPMFPGD